MKKQFVLIPSEVIIETVVKKEILIKEAVLFIKPDELIVQVSIKHNEIDINKLLNKECIISINVPSPEIILPPSIEIIDERFIMVKEGSKMVKAFYRDIISIEPNEREVMINQTNNKQNILPQTMNWCENNLPKDMFMRIHRCYIISKKQIKDFKVIKGRDGFLIASNDVKYPISRPHTFVFEDWTKTEIVIP